MPASVCNIAQLESLAPVSLLFLCQYYSTDISADNKLCYCPLTADLWFETCLTFGDYLAPV